jgi:serine/threonine protein kinase
MMTSSKHCHFIVNSSTRDKCPFQYCESQNVNSSVKHCWNELLCLTNHVVESYTIHTHIAQGTFGTVFLAETKEPLLVKEREFVAIKVFSAVVHPTATCTKEAEIAAEHECCILGKVASCRSNINSKFIVDFIEAVNFAVFNRPFAVIFRYFETTSYEDYCTQLTGPQLKAYMFGMLSALEFIHEKKVIHRDIKPGNCLFNVVSMEFKLCDFGLSTSDLDAGYAMEASETHYTRRDKVLKVRVRAGSDRSKLEPYKLPHEFNRSGTVGFRAPEVLFECGRQSNAIDMWSAGAVFCALLNKHPGYSWFSRERNCIRRKQRPKLTYKKMSPVQPWNTKCIAELIGVFGKGKVINAAVAVGHINPTSFEGRQYEAAMERNGYISIEDALRRENFLRMHVVGVGETFLREAFDIAFGCLQLIPSERLTAAEALINPFFGRLF